MKFEFNIDQVNLIMASLARMPYEQVFQIIENIKEQAAPQISGASTQPPPFETISTEELN